MPDVERLNQRAGARRAVGLAVALVLTVIVACGSDGDDATDSARPMTTGSNDWSAADATVPDDDTTDLKDEGEPTANASTGSVSEPGESNSSTIEPGGVDRARLPAGEGARGVTEATLKVGIARGDYAGAVALTNAMSGGSAEPPAGLDDRKAIEAATAYVNSTGGIAGRTVEVVYFDLDTTQGLGQGRREQEQAACARWTEDDPVFAFSGDGLGSDVMLNCAQDAQTPMVAIGPSQAFPSRSRFDSMPNYWYAPLGFVADRRERAVAAELVAEGFFGDGARVGIMIEDSPGIREGVAKGLKPKLAESGINPVVEIVYPDIIESPWANYVLQLQQADVTHVVMAATTGAFWPTLLMMQSAENQRFRPQWGVGSDHAPSDLAEFNAPSDQLENLTGVGWAPFQDLGIDSPPQSENTKLCGRVMKEVGLAESYANYAPCEFLFFLRAAFERATEISPDGLAAGVAKLGTSYPSVYLLEGATRLGPGRHDGATRARMVRYDTSCSCMQYVSGSRSLPE